MKVVKCKACGYIIAESALGEMCPACGATRAVFNPYTYTIGEKRRRILDLHLHSIAVHFPTTLAVAIIVFSAGVIFIPGQLGYLLLCTTQTLAVFLPLAVLLSMVAGLIDGKLRFRRLGNSQILKVKIIFTIIYLVLSCALVLIVWLAGFEDPFFA